MSSDRKNMLNDEEIGGVAGGNKADLVEMNGIVTEQLPNATFTVQLENGETITAVMSGRLRMNYIRLFVGDRVTVQIDPNLSKGRITYRFKQG